MKTIYLKNYAEPNYFTPEVGLEFEIYAGYTLVKAELKVIRNGDHGEPLRLNGEGMVLQQLLVDGRELVAAEYELDAEILTVFKLPAESTITTIVKIDPANNTRLTGLYKSRGIYCTQCESHGFRRITYFVDRPDNLAHFTTTISAPTDYPVLLANGNLVAKGGDKKRHWAKWSDPSFKPSYLFALVAGDLEWIEGKFVTMSGREVNLQVYAESGYKLKCQYALDSLKEAMRWEEEKFGREYDLDIYMILAVDDFNPGAMENKGLNIFNSKYVFVDPSTATDDDYANVLEVVGHEYFHNWTGNRVTCRDWFQLTLKEGLTKFREQLFSADHTSPGVKRIREANFIRSRQFSEDAGPMTHPPQPQSYVSMGNFYTVTVYHKGAEIVRMLYTILGPEKFRQGMDYYLTENDGKAVTIDEFLEAMAKAGNLDLTQFKKWYLQSGTPNLTVKDEYDAENKIYTLIINQDRDFYIPVAIGLLDDSGQALLDRILIVDKRTQEFKFENINSKPIPSLLRNFSAPVKLTYPYSDDALFFLMQHDTDQFNRWDAAQQLWIKIIFELIENFYFKNPMQKSVESDYSANRVLELNSMAESKVGEKLGKITAIFNDILLNETDLLFAAEILTLPTQAYLIELREVADVEAIFYIHEFVKTQLCENCYQGLLHRYKTLEPDTVAKRRLRNLILHYLMYSEKSEVIELCCNQFYTGSAMTNTIGALQPLSNYAIPESEKALRDFYQKWQHEPLVINKWFEICATSKLPTTLADIGEIANSTAFNIKNPNNVYFLIRSFAQNNHIRFHDISGAGYEFVADKVLEIDKFNPEVAARIIEPLIHWRKFDKARQQLMRTQLERILAEPQLSKNVTEIVAKSIS